MSLSVKMFFSFKTILSSSVPKSREGFDVVHECAVMIGRPVKSFRLELEAVVGRLCTFGRSFM